VNKTTIVVISAHARFISAMPVLLLGWVFACYGPSAFYLAVAEQNAKGRGLLVVTYKMHYVGTTFTMKMNFNDKILCYNISNKQHINALK
jgi:hypothetical protein